MAEKRGRKSIYETDIKPHIEKIKKAAQAGATLEEIAAGLGIAKSTLCKYIAEKTELKDAFARGRAEVVFEIKAALLKKALGYEYQEKKQYIKKDDDGESITYTEITTRHQPPSETAGAMLLRNYDDEWLDRDSVSTRLKQQELELKKAIAEANNFDLDIKE
jgi:AcrR family transcriptional regulator